MSSHSRFGRDTVEVLDALQEMKKREVRVIFEEEHLDTSDMDSNLMISIVESIAQAENVRLEKEKRSSVIETESGKQRKSTKYNLPNLKGKIK